MTQTQIHTLDPRHPHMGSGNHDHDESLQPFKVHPFHTQFLVHNTWQTRQAFERPLLSLVPDAVSLWALAICLWLKESYQDFSTVPAIFWHSNTWFLDIDRSGPLRLSKSLRVSFTHQGHWSFHCFRESRYGRLGWKVCFAMAAVAVGMGFGMFRGCGDPCSPLWTQNFSAFRSRVTHESQACSLAEKIWEEGGEGFHAPSDESWWMIQWNRVTFFFY